MRDANDHIVIRDFRAHVLLGATAEERSIAQPLDVEIELVVDVALARIRDRLSDTLDYALIHARVCALLAERAFVLLEHVADQVLREVVRYDRVLHAVVRVRKPHILAGATPELRVVGRPQTRVAVGLGGNIGPVAATLAAAVRELALIGADMHVSSLYETEPVGYLDQPRFFNAAASFTTHLMPHALLAVLKRLEKKLGRIAGPRFGPRAIDLDLLVDDGAVIADADLILPHPRLFERAFALMPLTEIDPAYAVALARLSEGELASVRRVAEWPTWGANPPLL